VGSFKVQHKNIFAIMDARNYSLNTVTDEILFDIISDSWNLKILL